MQDYNLFPTLVRRIEHFLNKDEIDLILAYKPNLALHGALSGNAVSSHSVKSVLLNDIDHIVSLNKRIYKIINEFKKTFKDSETYKKIILPEICADTFKNPWYDDSRIEKRNLENSNLQQMKEIKLKKTVENNNQIVNDFILSFTNLNNREPIESEIYDNLKDKMDIKILEKIIEDLKTIKNFEVLKQNAKIFRLGHA
jgi:hypothetical protein